MTEPRTIKAVNAEGLEYVIVRSRDAGVFAGYLADKEGNEVTLYNARRIWKWDGAATLSQLSIDGVSKPQNCKFPEAVKKIAVLGICELIPCTEKARNSIAEVKTWKA